MLNRTNVLVWPMTSCLMYAANAVNAGAAGTADGCQLHGAPAG